MGSRRRCSLPVDVEQAIEEVLDYLWHEEQRHFKEVDGIEKQNHVFRSLALIRRWLMNRRPVPTSD